ncbi:ABC transporter, permease protein [Amygdalobacter nucleatus]|uniref:ABC transporter, permease protein n=2 Tax=Amygdalobacter nucleatus TaxID=3029274 RepID=A0A133YG54_9FIRM|nr:ABC transporter, permease protein [Amygdalobacter nucleatus]
MEGDMHRVNKLKPWLHQLPFLIFILLLVVFPLAYTIYISFTNMSVYHWQNFHFVGVANYAKALFKLDSGFAPAVLRTLLWTALNVFLMLFIGFMIALALNAQGLRLKRVYKTLLIFPWAMPGYVSILLWRMGMFNTEFGFLNQLVKALGFAPINFLSTNMNAFVSCLVVNLWLGLPYMFTMIDAAIQSVDKSIYEGAKIDGASFWKMHFSITAPVILPILSPVIIMTAFTNFKQFDIVYLMTMQTGSKTGADINTIITYVYDKAFITSNYGFSAAITGLVSLLIIILYFAMQKSTTKEKEVA